ncbi:MAG: hypothetical protein KDI62_16485 [Anaerolineae bacterium]|nr:hypothetical protein [Anaerolineae bacterium]MCB9107626.1 hypothetical protein [Anaerolineales bacterium]
MGNSELTEQQRLWGQLYHWLHQRAEWLRQQQRTTRQSGEATEPNKETAHEQR